MSLSISQSRYVFLAIFVVVVPTCVTGQEGQERIRTSPNWERCSAGPWGALEKKSITFSIAADRLPAELLQPKVTRWIFPSTSPEELEVALTEANLSADDISQLTSSPTTRFSAGGSIVLPPDDLVASLSPVTRSKLYRLLGQSPANEPQYLPYQFRRDELEARLQKAKLNGKTKEQVRKLSYPGRKNTLFSDLSLLLRRTPDPIERRRVVELLKQYNSHQMRLVLDEKCDVDTVSRYWGDSSHLSPYLSALAESSQEVSIVELLTPFAKARLNTYPDRNARRPVSGPDCFWTAANFFNEVPDDAFFNPEMVTTYIQREYEKVASPKYGDVVLFVETRNKTPIHAAVFLADDLMFTKNGYHYWSPWTINTRQELEDMYGVHWDVDLHFFRKR